jgi:hypothetical protein
LLWSPVARETTDAGSKSRKGYHILHARRYRRTLMPGRRPEGDAGHLRHVM